ncbi:unnamed protein product (macronuclear) [Paramecium tetraurelia]|uniref:Protein kinase domain-containing protein n=1 Tax=Paramecium tetraurelia TaxID=5888 RepID=A0BQC5_PARTE|nr:uncharacterized protein GSPATT00030971001 [Paramecium tetraurelia]CAK60742.1 unnamed protein product [Paramecium tetraurelia]|eukprot:XP_001428140.1 hypothetical protein (macronuclear) [Paramecium tetraurelia strain d4-2]
MIDNSNTVKICNFLLQSNRTSLWSPSSKPVDSSISGCFHVSYKLGVFRETSLFLQGQNLYKCRNHKWKVCDIGNSQLEMVKHNVFGEGCKLGFGQYHIEIYGKIEELLDKLKKQCIQSNFTQKYSILKLMGQGTYGKVYRVKNKSNQKEFAVKTFEKSLLILPSDKIALAKELEIARLFEHPNLMQYYESFESEQFIFVVFELLLGGNLRQEIKKQRLSEKRAFSNIRQLLVALDHMHNLGVLHRDIKPENIMFRNSEELVLTDFGLADHYRKDGQYLFTNCGTPGYCAPELLQNKLYDFKVDVYSAGIVLFQMLTGQNPFDSDDYNKRVKLNKQGLIDWSIVNVSGDGLDFLQSLLSRNPFHRFTAAQALNHKIFNSDYGRFQRSGVSNTLVSTGSQLSSPNTKQLQIIPSPLQSPKINSLHQFEFDELDNLILEQSKKDKSLVNYPMLERKQNQQFQFNYKLQHRTTKSEVLLFFQE